MGSAGGGSRQCIILTACDDHFKMLQDLCDFIIGPEKPLSQLRSGVQDVARGKLHTSYCHLM